MPGTVPPMRGIVVPEPTEGFTAEEVELTLDLALLVGRSLEHVRIEQPERPHRARAA